MALQILKISSALIWSVVQVCQTLALALMSSGVSLPASSSWPPTFSMWGNTAPLVKRSRTSSRESRKLNRCKAPKGRAGGRTERGGSQIVRRKFTTFFPSPPRTPRARIHRYEGSKQLEVCTDRCWTGCLLDEQQCT